MSMSLEQAWNKHLHCSVVIHQKQFTNGLVTPGLYCKQHGKLIQWLDRKTADELINQGVEQVLVKPKKRITSRDFFYPDGDQ
jgi:hypothetical protein